MEPLTQLEHIVGTLDDAVDEIRPEQLDDPTPCSNFTVRDVLDHMIVLGTTFSYQFRGESPPEVTAPPVHDRVPTAEFHDAMAGLVAAVASPDAAERTITSPFGDLPGETFARLVAFDGLVHGWDLAKATGVDFDVPDTLVDTVTKFARATLTDEFRDGDTFKAPTPPPPRATPLERLAAFSGRTV